MTVKRIAIIGLGSIGKRHFRILKTIRPSIEIVLVRSGNGSACEEERSAFKTVRSVQEVIALGIDAAIISGPATTHIEYAKILASAGIHMLIEKPLSDKTDGIEELMLLVSEKILTVLVGYVLRHDLAARKFYELISSQAVGRLLHARIECSSFLPDWRPEQDYRTSVSASVSKGGGALLELSHELDYSRWFFGDMSCVFGYLRDGGVLDVEAEESTEAVFLDYAGAPVSIHVDFNTKVPTRTCKAYGENGMLVWDGVRKMVAIEDGSGIVFEQSFDYGRDFMYERQLQHFLECVENGERPFVTLKDGYEVVKMIEGVRASHKNRAGVQK